jgi:hypothetical protein
MNDHINRGRMSAVPQYWDLLSPSDEQSYAALQQSASNPSRKSRRNRSLQTFGETVDSVKSFVVRVSADDWKRSLVCGICWLSPDGPIGVNTRQLRILIGKCKSSINGSFQLLGFGNVPAGTDCRVSIAKLFPILKDNFAELRQWTLGQPAADFVSPAPEVPQRETSIDRFADIVISPAEALAKENFEMSVWDDPMAFMPNEADLRNLDDGLRLAAKAEPDFAFDPLE